MEWQPIETCPTDQEVILYIPTRINPDRTDLKLPAIQRIDHVAFWRQRNPTHWMPLPEPPEGA